MINQKEFETIFKKVHPVFHEIYKEMREKNPDGWTPLELASKIFEKLNESKLITSYLEAFHIGHITSLLINQVEALVHLEKLKKTLVELPPNSGGKKHIT